MKLHTMRLLRISLWLNLGMVLFGTLLFPFLSLHLAMMPAMRVTDLDRNSVINESALQEHYPSLAANAATSGNGLQKDPLPLPSESC